LSAALVAARGCLPATLHENGTDSFRTRGVPGYDVEEFLHGLWLVMAELMHQRSIVHVGPERRDDVGIADLGEFMALSRETPDVVPLGFPFLLLATLQIPGITRPHVCALEVSGKDLLEILTAIDQVPGQVFKPGFGHVVLVNGEELDGEKVVAHSARPARKAVVP
jgi:hypothetical protein